MRKAIPPKVRFQVLNRDNFECKYCWLKAWNWVQLQVDHIIPVIDWWTNDLWNLITSCFECNSWKWKTKKENHSKNIYKTKEDEEKLRIKNIFQEKWNINQLWLIDKNTYILLMRFISECMKSWLESTISMIAYQNLKSIEDIYIDYRIGWEFCESVLRSSWVDWYFPYEDYNWSILEYVMWDFWRWKCENNYNNRLNYTLTENLLGIVPFSFLMKFSYFYNEIKNEQN